MVGLGLSFSVYTMELIIPKKAFLSEQCKEIEEDNRMGKTRDFFKKLRDTKGTFHAEMGTIKDRNGMKKKVYKQTLERVWKKVNALALLVGM